MRSKIPFQERLNCVTPRANPASPGVMMKRGGAKSSAPSAAAATAAPRKAMVNPEGVKKSRAAHTASTGTRSPSCRAACIEALDRESPPSVRKPLQPCSNTARANAAIHASRIIEPNALAAAHARASRVLATAAATSTGRLRYSLRSSNQKGVRAPGIRVAAMDTRLTESSGNGNR